VKAGPRLATLIGVAFLLTALLARLPAHAEDTTLPAPKTVIYPGEIIREDMLADMPADNLGSRVGPICDTRNALVGKMARRTLLPGEAIAVADVSNPRLVVNGAEVTLYYIEEGLSIATSASALQDGAAGDTVRVRNNDSGVVISGAVQPDGSVRVGGG
jgi:flagellar basal body P-ring formation protein FlgA